MREQLRSRLLTGLPILSLVAGASAISVACAEEFTSCEDTLTCESGGGESGAGGTGGADGEAGAGEGGAAGGSHDEPCDDEGATECVAGDEGSLRVCSDGIWELETCAGGEVCTGEPASCAVLAPGCEELAPGAAFCEENTRHVCSDDRTTSTEEACEGACIAGECLPPGCGDGILHDGEACDDGNAEPGDGCGACRWEVVGVHAMCDHSCARFADGRLKCWGYNGSGQLGIGDTRSRGANEVDMGVNLRTVDLPNVTDVAGSCLSTCAISDGSLWCWGANEVGELGLGVPSTAELTPVKLPFSPARRFRSIEASGTYQGFFCALPEDETERPLCWGRNDRGQTGAAWAPLQPELDPAVDQIGDEIQELPRNPGPNVVGPTSLALGYQTACAIANGTVHCWGEHSSGQLGSSTATYYGYYVTDTAVPPEVQLGPSFVPEKVYAGARHSCVVGTTGTVKCWGEGLYGKLGMGGGRNVQGWSTLLTTQTAVVGGEVDSMALGSDFTCALLRGGDVKCWGQNWEGALGQPEITALKNHLGDRPNEIGEALPPIRLGGAVRSISAGLGHVCALLTNAEVKCWGRNSEGQLGKGSSGGVDSSIGDDPGEMDALRAVELE